MKNQTQSDIALKIDQSIVSIPLDGFQLHDFIFDRHAVKVAEAVIRSNDRILHDFGYRGFVTAAEVNKSAHDEIMGVTKPEDIESLAINKIAMSDILNMTPNLTPTKKRNNKTNKNKKHKDNHEN